jgi:mannose-6-phosphate isomerase class I
MAFLEPKKWISWLPLAEWWYNTNYDTSLKSTPFEALCGFKPLMMLEVLVPGLDSLTTEFLTQHMMTKLRENLIQAQERMKIFADSKRTEREFMVGDMVYLKLQPFKHHALDIH